MPATPAPPPGRADPGDFNTRHRFRKQPICSWFPQEAFQPTPWARSTLTAAGEAVWTGVESWWGSLAAILESPGRSAAPHGGGCRAAGPAHTPRPGTHPGPWHTRGYGTPGDTRGHRTPGDTWGHGTDTLGHGDTRGHGTPGDTRGHGTSERGCLARRIFMVHALFGEMICLVRAPTRRQ